MPKKILFMVINMNVGGTEKALLNMISAMPKDKFDITILMLEEFGGFLNHIPSGVTLEYLKDYKNIKDLLNLPPQLMALKLFKKGLIIKGLALLILHITTKILKDRSLFFKYILRKNPSLEKEYDIAVAYAGPTDIISYFVINKIKATKKLQWVHFDVTKIGFNRKFAAKTYIKFDKVFVVSNEAKNKLVSMLPSLKEKTSVFQNIVSSCLILNQAKKGQGFNDKFHGLRILTVGRLSNEKGQDLAIKSLKKLIDDGFNVRWYCVGDGNSRGEYEDLIKKNNLQSHFFLLGSNPNPYPYIDQCDIYVQPSRHEGYCITLAEARCLNKPILTTNFTGAREQIRNGENGLIVEVDEDQIFIGIKKLISDSRLRERFSARLAAEGVSSSFQVNEYREVGIDVNINSQV